jgi:hypothetical protein
MLMEFAVHFVDPEAGEIFGDHDVFGTVEDEEVLTGFGVFDEFSNVNVGVTLGSTFDAIIGHAPVGSPKFLALCNGCAEEFGTVGGGEVGEIVRSADVLSSEGEKAVGLSGVGVFEEEYALVDRLLFRLAAEAAVDGRHSFWLGDVAGAIADVEED